MKKLFLFIIFFVLVFNLIANNIVPEQGNPPPYPGLRGQDLKGKDIYTVKKGDTLWEICAKKLNNPWKWIAVWERNPHIKNPNWIYPKDKITLDLSGPIKESYIREENRKKYKDKKISGVFKFKDDKSAKKMEKPLPREKDLYEDDLSLDITKENVIKEEKARQQKIESMRYRAGFILEKEIENYGEIIKSENDGLIMLNSIVYIDMGKYTNIKKGQELIIFEMGKTVEHPITYQNLGKIIEPLGSIKILSVDNKVSKAKVVKQLSDIEKGDKVIFEYPRINLGKEKIKTDYTGYISYIKGNKSVAGEYDFVYLDLGIKQGIKTGMHFDILTEVESVKSKSGIRDIPSEKKGEILVINSRKNVSTGVIESIKKNYKIKIGDIIKVK